MFLIPVIFAEHAAQPPACLHWPSITNMDIMHSNATTSNACDSSPATHSSTLLRLV
jgi:hypothetical protein